MTFAHCSALAAIVILSSCVFDEEPDGGTAVGNPSVTTMAIASGDDFTIAAASASVASIRYTDCFRRSATEEVGGIVDLLGGTLELRAGSWCEIAVDFDGPVTVSASWSDGGDPATIELTLAPGTLGLVPDGGAIQATEADAFILEFASPGWLDAAALGLVAGGSLVVDEASPEHEGLVAAIEDDSALFEDTDADGVLLAAERDSGPVATIGEPSFEDADAAPSAATGCSGCSSAPAPGGGAAILLFVLALLRRRTILAPGCSRSVGSTAP